MSIKEVISEEEIKEYHNQWDNFKSKYNPETPYIVHSSYPVIGKVFQYKDKPLFRAKILKRSLRKIDPYFLGKKEYIHANFHLVHYFIPIEQIFHSAMIRLSPDYNNFIMTDKFSKKSPEMYDRIHFDKNHPSIEMIINFKKNPKKLLVRLDTTFYEDKNNEVLQKWYLDGIGRFRPYVDCIEKLKEKFDKEIAEDLIQKINDQYLRQNRLAYPRQNLPKKDYLIEKLNEGIIPEKELHNFFSFWESN